MQFFINLKKMLLANLASVLLTISNVLENTVMILQIVVILLQTALAVVTLWKALKMGVKGKGGEQ
jgi:hypothetical protein